MGSEPDQIDDIRRQIEASRENLGQAVAALAYKADVKNRGKELLSDKKEALMEKVDDLKSKLPGGGEGEGGVGETIKAKLPSGEDLKSKLPSGEGIGEKVDALKSRVPGGVGEAAGRIGDAAPSAEDVKAKARGAADAAKDHPIAVTAGAAAAGLVAGLALPETDLEREKIGPAARQVREQVQSGVQDAVSHAKQVARDAASSAAQATKEVGQKQGGKVGEIAEKTADKANEKVNPQTP